MRDSQPKRPVEPTRLPKSVQWILGRLLPQQYRETVLGDFAEEYFRRINQTGCAKAKLWCWLELLKSSPAFLHLSASNLSGSLFMELLAAVLRQNVKLAWLGLLLIIPAVTLFTGGMLQTLLGDTRFTDALETAHLDLILLNPAVLIGGLFLALALNLLPVFRLTLQNGTLVGSIKFRGRGRNLLVITSVTMLFTAIFLYLLAENFQIFAR